ncbi:larval cuticle protein 65Ab1-like [Drosophila tropicalis]|uniref:larval cuticle protein 65Ab1-like n=1 Tax=Drosophila tropicalis TaxID=46794 RepID=UPI0035ABF54E
MLTAKLLLFTALVACMATYSSAGLLDYIYPKLATEFYKQEATPDGYRFSLEEPNGSKREEIGVIINPGTEQEEHVRMGTYSSYDEKTDTETITMYTADKNGYKSRYEIKNRKLSPGALKSASG